jgi:hypothetical protein
MVIGAQQTFHPVVPDGLSDSLRAGLLQGEIDARDILAELRNGN